MIPTEPVAKPASTPKTGLFAKLRAPLHGHGSGAPLRTPLVLAFVTAALVLCSLASSAAPALATQFGSGEGSGVDQIADAFGVAVDQESGSVYVADTGNERIDKFTGQGGFLLAWGWGVADGSTEALQTCITQCFAGIGGGGAGQLYGPEGIAVDNDPLSSARHDVYVAERDNTRVERFGPEGEFQLTFGGKVNRTAVEAVEAAEANGETPTSVQLAAENLCTAESGDVCQKGREGTGQGEFENLAAAISVGATGDVYVGDRERVQVFSSAGVYQSETALPASAGPRTLSLAVDTDSSSPSFGDVYVTNEREGEAPSELIKLDPTSHQIIETQTIETQEGEFGAVTVDPATGDLIVTRQDEGSPPELLEYGPAGQELASSSLPDGFDVYFTRTGFLESADELIVAEGSAVQTIPPIPPGPYVDREEATPEPAGTATLKATINPEGRRTSYHFEYGLEGSQQTASATATMTAEGFTSETVEVKVSGLTPEGVYHYHVVAEDGEHHVAEGADEAFHALPAVVIDSLSVSEVTATSAKLEAEINPLGTGTSYQFEYGAGGTHGFTPEVNIGAGAAAVAVSVKLQGLLPGSVYQYRVLAKNALGSAEATREFTSQAAGSGLTLPDGRQWEMVSPPDKEGAQIYAIGQYSNEGAVIQAAATGDAITYVATAPTESQPQGYTNLEQVLSTRGPDGWESKDISPPHDSATGPSIGNGEEYRFFSEDLSQAVVQPFGVFMPSLSEQASEQTAYLRNNTTGTYVPLVTGKQGVANVPPGTVFGGKESECVGGHPICGPEFVGATPDASHIVVHSTVGLTSTPGDEGGFYEWSDGHLQPVSVLPESEVVTKAADFGGVAAGARNAISSDGSRIVWSEFGGAGQLYLRDMTTKETVQLDAAEPGCETCSGGRGKFQIASSDGSKVFFTDTQRLTNDSGAKENSQDLYECEIVKEAGKLKCKLSDLTPARAGESANVIGNALGASEDGSYVYFVANGVLTTEANARGEVAVLGTCPPANSGEKRPEAICNLYVRQGGVTKLVAVLSAEDLPDWSETSGGETARVAPDGDWLAFMSQRELTGYDNHDAVSGKPDEEVYLYNAENNKLVCASCDPTGARPVGVEYGNHELAGGEGIWESSTWLAANIPDWTPYSLGQSLYQSRYLSDSGRLFFNAHDALVPQDVNGNWDVYEYEPPGVPAGEHACTSSSATFSERSGGCVGLISSGSSAEESAFLDASENGSDVFFLTTAKLAPQDYDDSVDIYDAHECTSAVPCFPPVAEQPPACTTEAACKAAPTPQPSIFGSPSSATFSGAGNVTPAPTTVVQSKAKPLTRAQKLAKALKGCKRDKKKSKRSSCERQARKKYGGKAKKASNKRRAKS